MNRRFLTYLSLAVLLLLSGADYASAQLYPERRHIRQGNRDYEKGDFVESETDYRRALEKIPESYEAQFNLGNALYRQGRFDEAAQTFSKLGTDSLRTANAPRSFYNQGNALFQQRKLEEALEAYKNSLRRNPDDMEAKFNLAYVKKLLEKDNDDQNNEDNKDNKDNQNNQNNQDNKDNQDQNSDQDKDNNQPPPPQKDQQQQESPMSREEAQQMLDAMQMNEDKTREKMDEKKAAAVAPSSGKNW